MKEARKSSRLADVSPFYVMDIMARAQALEQAGREIAHMEIGEPDFPTPLPIIKAGQQALQHGKTFYTPAAGLPQLRETISRFYGEQYGISIDYKRIIVTPGGSGALQLVLAALCDDQRSLLLPDPGYPCNKNIAHILGIKTLSVPVTADNGFHMTAVDVSAWADKNISALLLASPANPSGVVLKKQALQEIINTAIQKGIHPIIDEIYHGLVYGEQAETALSCSDDVFVINSFSKYFGMSGWRIGWLVAPEAYVDDIEKMAQNLFLSPSTIAQHAAMVAFDASTMDILEKRREIFKSRKEYLLPAVKSLGFNVPCDPDGAFYIYADCSKFSKNSFDLCQCLLNDAGVALTPGRDFGQHNAATYLRFAFTSKIEKMERGMERLSTCLTNYL